MTGIVGEVDLTRAVLQPVPVTAAQGIHADMLRLDLIHPVISGNKWFKLKFHFSELAAAGAEELITYGGAWSNHLVAAACMAQQAGIAVTGIVRGERPLLLSNTLQQAAGYGMRLQFVNRAGYAAAAEQCGIIPDGGRAVYHIPQGGAGEAGIKGCEEIMSLVNPDKYSHIICCIGTGTMFEGIARTLGMHQHLLGVVVMKSPNGFPALELLAEAKGQSGRSAEIITGYHFGGYARKTPALLGAMNRFFEDTGIPTDFVYTGKLVFAVQDMIGKNYFPAGSRLLVVHSGGLQGNDSLPAGSLIF